MNTQRSSLTITLATLHPQKGEGPSLGSMEVAGAPGTAPSPQSEAVTTELQELSIQPAPNKLPLQERKNGLTTGRDHDPDRAGEAMGGRTDKTSWSQGKSDCVSCLTVV
ncbi:hypothetical protein PAMP_010623 [Pampus punctatissimus]